MKARFRLDTDIIREATGDAIRLGRDAECEIAFDVATFPKVSSVHARIEPTRTGFVLVHLSQTNRTLLNDQPIGESAPVAIGDRIRLGYSGPTLEIVSLEPLPTVEACITIHAEAPQLSLLRGSARSERFILGAGGILGRLKGEVQFHLGHPLVSRRHARIDVDNGATTVRDLGTSNGTFVNGDRISKPTTLTIGDRLDIGPYALEYDGIALISQSRTNNIELVARGVSRVVMNRGTGQPLTLLDDISIVVKPREFVCLLGPSGSGKSTLLNLLSGRVVPDGGAVLVNGLDLTANFRSLKHDIAVVPQRDALHDTLRVDTALGFTAKLRLPPDTDRDELRETVADILDVVGLEPQHATPIRHLSGGQLKRASLANEILSRPSLLFLDEVTSGLDEQADRGMMELFRLIAEGGKSVVCITHNLANVEEYCHLVVILTVGGKLAFVGTPAEAKLHFRVKRLGDIYKQLATRPAAEWQQEFRESSLHVRYVQQRLPAGEAPPPAVKQKATLTTEGVAYFNQTQILMRRMAAIWNSDRPALAALVGQCVLVALLMVMVFGHQEMPAAAATTPSLLFLLAVSSFWFGCNTAAKELVKERIIYERERAFNLRPASYFLAKFLVLLVIGSLQVSLLFLIVQLGCEPAGNVMLLWLTLMLLMAAGTAVGLLISAFAKTEEMATALVPIVVIPQIIMGGGIAVLSGAPEKFAKLFITTFWGRDSLWKLSEHSKAIELPLIVIAVHAVAACLATLVLLHKRRS